MFRYREAIGLDISEDAARIVHVRRSLFRLGFRRSLSVPLSGDPEEAADVLRGVFQKHNWFRTPCVIGLRGESLMLRALKCEAGDRAGIRAFVTQQMEHFRSLSNAPTVTEHIISGRGGSEPVMIVGMARMDTVLEHIDYARRIGINVVNLVPGPLAVYNAISCLAPWSMGPTVCVDVAARSTQVVIGSGRSISFARRYLIGADHLAGRAASESDQPELFIRPGQDAGAASNLSGDAFFKEWLAELNGCLKFSLPRLGGGRRKPAGRIIVGGTDRFPPEWLERLRSSSGLEALHLRDLPRAKKIDGDARLVAATGFALAGVGCERVKLSLLPRNLKEAYTLAWQVKYWLAAGLALVSGLSLMLLRMRADVRRQSSLLEAKRGMLAHLEDSQRRLDELEAENRTIEWQVQTLRAAAGNGKIFEAVLDAVARAKHSEDWITLIADSSSYFRQDIGRAGEDRTERSDDQGRIRPAVEPVGKIVLEGYTPLDDLSTVRAMIEKLRKSPLVADVDLLPDDKVRQNPETRNRWSGYSKTRFAIEISMVEP